MALADSIVATADRLLKQYGADVTITQQLDGVYDPTTSTNPLTVQTMTIKGLPEEYAESLRFLGQKLAVPSGITEDDKKITIAGKGLKFIPAPGDKASVTGLTYQIMGVAAIYINNVIPVYVLHIRKT